MRLLYIQDAHCSGKNSENRKGNYLQDWKLKFEEVFKIAKERQVDCIIDGGDLLHSSNVAYSISDYLIDIIEQYKIPYIALYGNHCQQFHSVDLSKSTTFYHMLYRCKHMSHLMAKEDSTCIVRGLEYCHNIEEEIKNNGIIFEETPKFKIVVVHALLTPKPLPFQAAHVCIKNIKTNADLILVAHNHRPFDVTIDNTRFLNIGCFGRKNIDEAKTQPSVVYIDTETGQIRIVPLKSAKLGSEVFNPNSKKEKGLDIEEFMKSFGNIKTRGLNTRDQIETVGKELGSTREAMNLLINQVD